MRGDVALPVAFALADEDFRDLRVPHRLRLEFVDIRSDGDGTMTAPELDHVERIVEFAPVADGKRTLIHCQAGISRSTAAAFIITAVLLGPGSELEALAKVLAVRPIALPNTRMVRFADEILARDGALMRALAVKNLVL